MNTNILRRSLTRPLPPDARPLPNRFRPGRHRALLLLLLALLALAAHPLSAQFYTDQAWSLKQTSDLYDERGFEHGKVVAVDGKLNIVESNGSVGYSYPIASYTRNGYPINVALNYCGSVGFSAFCDYDKGPFKVGGGSPAQAWRKFHQNRPAWVVGVNGFAVQMISQVTAAHSSPAKVNYDFTALSGRKQFNDKDFVWLADGYDYSNRMRSFYSASFEGGLPSQEFVDVIHLLRADGSVLELHNSKQAINTHLYFSDSLYTGYYHSNEANSHTFAVVTLDPSRVPAFMSVDSAHYTKPRMLRLYQGDGLEYVFREYIIPYGTGDYYDVNQQFGGEMAGPTIFYLEEINSNGGQILSFKRSRHYPQYTADPTDPANWSNRASAFEQDSTKGRALTTEFGETSISYDDNWMTIQSLGRTTLVKFDTVLASHGASPASGIPFWWLGYPTNSAGSLAATPISDAEQYQGYIGYVTEIIDPESRITRFDYERVNKSYKGFSFPLGGSGDGSYGVNLTNVRLKEVTEPTARFLIGYHAEKPTGGVGSYTASDTIPIYSSTYGTQTTDPWLLTDMASTVKKYDNCGTLLTTDAYDFTGGGTDYPTLISHSRHAITDNIAGTTRWLTYDQHHHWLPDILPKLPKGCFTEVYRVADSIPGFVKVTTTTYDSLAPFMVRPAKIEESVNGLAKTITTKSYTIDTARTFNGDGLLIQYYGKEVTSEQETHGCACDTTVRATVIAGTQTTTYYQHLRESSSGQYWIQVWGFDKIKSYHNYDSAYSFVVGGETYPPSANPNAPTWEEAMYRPGIGVYKRIDTVLMMFPPIYGLPVERIVTDGHELTDTKTIYTTTMRFDTVPRGRVARSWTTGFIGSGGTGVTAPGDSIDYVRSQDHWLLGRVTNGNGAVSDRFYKYQYDNNVWPRLSNRDTALMDTTGLHYLSAKIIDDRDSVWNIQLANGEYFSYAYETPSVDRHLVHKPNLSGGYDLDTLDSYTERTFYGLVGGGVDQNGWYSRTEYDHDGRLKTLWLPKDFNLSQRVDTSAFTGILTSTMSGYTVDTLVHDTVNCNPLGTVGAAVKVAEAIDGQMYADNPVITRPECPSCSKTIKGDADATRLAATCTSPIPYDYLSRATAVFHCPFLPGDASHIASLDSASLRILVTRVVGHCVNLVVTIPQFGFSRTYTFNCVNLGGSGVAHVAAHHAGGKGDEGNLLTESGDGCGISLTANPHPPGFILKVDLTSLKDSLIANAVRGRNMTVLLNVATSGAAIYFSGDFYDDYRPQMVMKGSFSSYAPHTDFTLAYDRTDDSLRTVTRAKVDDGRHTASNIAAGTIRTTRRLHQFGADYRLDRSYVSIGDPSSPSRIDSIANGFDGNGNRTSMTDQAGNVVATEYDAAGRPVDVTNADGTHTRFAYYYGTASSFGIPAMTSTSRYTTSDFDTTVSYTCDFALAKVTTNEDGTKSVQYYDALDRLRREVADSGGTGHLHLTTTYDYDDLGRLTQVINPKSDTTWYSYDELGRTRYKHQPDLGTVSYAYDHLGNVRFTQTEQQVSAGAMTFSEYDDLNRLTVVGEASIDRTSTTGGDGGGGGIVVVRTAPVGGSGNGITGRGGKRGERSSLMGGPTYADTALHRLTDTLNAAVLNTAPYSSAILGNLSMVVNPASGVVAAPALSTYDSSECGLGLNTMLGETDPPTVPFIRHPIQYYEPVTLPRAGTTDFENLTKYPHFGRMAIAYDELPLKKGPVWANLPDAAQWDSLAPRKKVRNLRGRTSAIAYREHGGEPYHYIVQSYDERGRVEALLRFTENIGFDAVYYTYNSMNQVTSVRVADPIRQYATWYGYDWNGRVDSVWAKLGGTWSGLGIKSPVYVAPLTHPSTSADIAYAYTKTGEVAQMAYPPVSVLVTYAYDHRRWLDSLVATQSASPLFKEVLGYDPTGQIISQRYRHGSSTEQSEIYRYDSVQRLLRWVHGTDSTSWGYDNVGNRIGQAKRVPLLGLRTDTYNHGGVIAGGSNRLAEVVTQDSTGAITGLRDYGYNANGSMTSQTTRGSLGGPTLSEEHYVYDYREQLRQYVNGATSDSLRLDWRYKYGPGGEREQKRLYYDHAGDENGNVYPWVYYLLGGTDEQLAVYHGQQTAGTTCDAARAVYFYPTEYISTGVGYNGVRETISPLITLPDGSKHYRISDHLASLRAEVTSAGTTTYDYDPWGSITAAAPSATSRATFNDQEEDKESGLYDVSFRKLDPGVGRFTSIDALHERQPWESPYSYCANNPLRNTDPTGLQASSIMQVPLNEGGEGVPTGGAVSLEESILNSAGMRQGEYDVAPRTSEPGEKAEESSPVSTESAEAAQTAPETTPEVAKESAQAHEQMEKNSGSKGDRNTPASTPVGRSGKPFTVPKGPDGEATNSRTTVNGREYSGHALDRMQERGFTPTVVENTIQYGRAKPGNNPLATKYWDPVNDISAIVNQSSGTVITVRRGN